MPLEKIRIRNENGTGEVYLQGAHVTEWTPQGARPVLFLGSRSLFESGKAIRGGVPLIFPWFGPRHDGQSGPAHGLARTALWKVLSQTESNLLLAARIEEMDLRFEVSMGRLLEMSLDVHNPTGEPFRYEEALHTYFAVGDVRQVALTGLEGTTYIDKTDGMKQKIQPAHAITSTERPIRCMWGLRPPAFWKIQYGHAELL